MRKNNGNSNSIKDFIEFYHKAEKLKTTLRHSWLSDSERQESSAEHSWMLGLLTIILSDELDKKVDILRVIKMVIVHDLAEAVTGDIPSFEISDRQNRKHDAEKHAMTYLVSSLSKKTADEIVALWEEFDACKTVEAQFANSLDKIEVLIQHNLADISTWCEGDYRIGPYYKDHYFNFDTFMRSFKNHVDIDTMKKIIDAKQERQIDAKHLERYHEGSKKQI